MQFPGDLRSTSASGRASGQSQRVVYTDGAMSPDEITALTGLFPNLVFERLSTKWPEHFTPNLNILIVGVNAASNSEVEKATNLVRACPPRLHVLFALRNADVASSRALTRAGAADVIPLPANDAVWALAIERLLARDATPSREHGKKPGQVVALLKAGGGAGATSLGVQAAYQLAARRGDNPGICFADLDLQFGAAALYFDLAEALTVTDCVAVGEVLEETQFATELAAHKSGVRVLAAPREAAPLDMLTPQLIDALIGGLRRDFALTILDLPSIWTAWTNHALQLCDRIILVTRLSVSHVHLVRRQLSILGGAEPEQIASDPGLQRRFKRPTGFAVHQGCRTRIGSRVRYRIAGRCARDGCGHQPGPALGGSAARQQAGKRRGTTGGPHGG